MNTLGGVGRRETTGGGAGGDEDRGEGGGETFSWLWPCVKCRNITKYNFTTYRNTANMSTTPMINENFPIGDEKNPLIDEKQITNNQNTTQTPHNANQSPSSAITSQ